MKNQIKRARMFFDEAEKGVTELSEASRWPVNNQEPFYQYKLCLQILDEIEDMNEGEFWMLMQVWASLLLYRQILDEIEANDYNNFTKRAYVSKVNKIAALPISYARSLIRSSRKALAEV